MYRVSTNRGLNAKYRVSTNQGIGRDVSRLNRKHKKRPGKPGLSFKILYDVPSDVNPLGLMI